MTDRKDPAPKHETQNTVHSSSRRRILTALAAGTGAAVLLPEKWVKPIVDKVMVPAHAQATTACSAPARCYGFGRGYFSWPGGQGPERELPEYSDANCTQRSGVLAPLVVAASEDEAKSLLGNAGIAVTRVLPLPTSPSPPQSCLFYFEPFDV